MEPSGRCFANLYGPMQCIFSRSLLKGGSIKWHASTGPASSTALSQYSLRCCAFATIGIVRGRTSTGNGGFSSFVFTRVGTLDVLGAGLC